ncbi:MAG: DUF116 domain-containing protein [Candidatus Desulfatibia sp.]|uniref:lipoyl protein ligase domain-containing protein n=1 Tax=Candidatus Desulfatibia sp. TaxID=3101189 RepID=UPI002F2D53BF
MNEKLRVIDTGLLSAAENIAWDRALMEARQNELIPDTIRFLRFTPSALVGYHQSVKDEIRVDYCKVNGIEINRRVTGGGAIYFDEGQLGWELIFKRSSLPHLKTMWNVSKSICESAASALRGLGVNAHFRPRNDIEVYGKKISGTGGAFEKDVVLFQGTLLVDFNIEHLIRALRIPVEKLADKELLSAKERVASLSDLLGVPPPMETIKSMLANEFSSLFGKPLGVEQPTENEKKLYRGYLKETAGREWIEPAGFAQSGNVKQIHAFSKSKGGLLHLTGRFDVPKGRLKQILVTGDVFVTPKRLLYDMENALKDTKVERVISELTDFLDGYEFEGVELSEQDFISAVGKLIEKYENMKHGLEVYDVNSIETRGAALGEISGKAEVLLLPYCAKPLDCKHRNADSCEECGKCTVGEAYTMAKEAGMRVISINNYENLVGVLENEKKMGTKAFIGACCSAFFKKRHKAFVDSGMPCAIVDIDDTTCYELNEESIAYLGRFQRQTNLKIDVLKKVIDIRNKRRHFKNSAKV